MAVDSENSAPMRTPCFLQYQSCLPVRCKTEPAQRGRAGLLREAFTKTFLCFVKERPLVGWRDATRVAAPTIRGRLVDSDEEIAIGQCDLAHPEFLRVRNGGPSPSPPRGCRRTLA
jgi:hypothetical protein